MNPKFLGAIPYTGSKQTLLSDLLPLFPDNIDTFYDVFCGGLSVSLSVEHNVVALDIETPLVDMYKMLRAKNDISFVQEVIEKFGLSTDDPAPYNSLRDEYNRSKNPEYLYTLLMFAFCNMYRTNKKGGFNTPFGNNRFRGNRGGYKDVWNERFQILRNKDNLMIVNAPYNSIDPRPGDFVYCDPPYLITGAQYNSKWGEEGDINLYQWLDSLDASGVKFGLSNVTHHSGKENRILIEWMKKYTVHDLNKEYKMNQIQGVDNKETREVYVCNYAKQSVNSSPFNLEDFM